LTCLIPVVYFRMSREACMPFVFVLDRGRCLLSKYYAMVDPDPEDKTGAQRYNDRKSRCTIAIMRRMDRLRYLDIFISLRVGQRLQEIQRS